MNRIVDSDRRAWSEVRGVAESVRKEQEASKNALIVAACEWNRKLWGGASWTPPATTGRERRAQLRLLRVAVHYRATGEILELDDPFGTGILYAQTTNHLRVWSIGADGMDDGGAGCWKPRPTGDIVLDIDR